MHLLPVRFASDSFDGSLPRLAAGSPAENVGHIREGRPKARRHFVRAGVRRARRRASNGEFARSFVMVGCARRTGVFAVAERGFGRRRGGIASSNRRAGDDIGMWRDMDLSTDFFTMGQKKL